MATNVAEIPEVRARVTEYQLHTKAVAVDPESKDRNLKRLRRIEGQVRGLQKMVEEDRYCPDILTQISSVQEALRSVGRELMRNHLKHCATQAIRSRAPFRTLRCRPRCRTARGGSCRS